jgi:hypothetical protein
VAFPRQGGFGGGLNPFGTGNLSNLGAYDIGQDLADYAIYEASVGWQNGTVTDTDYLAALQRKIDATDPGTRARLAAEDQLNDAKYRIGRAAVNDDLDALIAFDQRSLAGMNPDNLRYRGIKESLDNELAQRRSRDYGKLVTDYNAGKGSTESLLAWVQKTRAALPENAPDKDNWDGVFTDLTERIASEKDSKVYQDFQQNRITPAAFLAYVKGRRDSFATDSPQYDDWARRYEDAAKSVKDDAQSKKDQAFFNNYTNGKVSDTAYLRYISNRIKAMDPNDPSLPEWKQRLHQAAFSVAEDELRFKVQLGKAPVSRLIAFYQNYRRGLNPNSPEYRQITRAIMSLGGSGGGGGGGGGGGRAGGGTASAGAAIGKGPALGKNISPKYTLDSVLGLLTVNPRAASKDRKAAAAAFDANHTSLMNAVQRGDATWVFFDPRKPGQTIALRDADGKVVRDKAGKPIMIPGSAYLPTSGTALANLDMLKANYHSGLAAVALSKHDTAGYFKELARASNAVDAARLHQGQQITRDNRELYKQVQAGIDEAMKVGDWATAINLGSMLRDRITDDLTIPGLDDTRRTQLETMIEKLTDSPLLPTDVDANGRAFGGAIDWASTTTAVDPATGRRVVTGVALNPGWHMTLDRPDPQGRPTTWGLQFDTRQDGTWERDHVTVTTTYGGRTISGEVKKGKAPVSPMVSINTPEGGIMAPAGDVADFISYTDEHGRVVRAYSVDGGRTWVKPEDGSLPVLQVRVPGLQKGLDDDGNEAYVDGNGEIVFKLNQDGSWIGNERYFAQNPGSVQFYNQDALDAPTTLMSGRGGLGTPFTRDPVTGEIRWGAGAPGALMTIVHPDADGNIDLSKPAMQRLTSNERSLQVSRFGDGRERNIDRPDAVPFRPTGEPTRGPAKTPNAQRSFDRLDPDKPERLLDMDREADAAYGGPFLIHKGKPPPVPVRRAPAPVRNIDRMEGQGLRDAPAPPTLAPRSTTPGLPTVARAVVKPPAVRKRVYEPPVKKPVARKVIAKPKPKPKPRPRPRPTVVSNTAKTGTSRAI